MNQLWRKLTGAISPMVERRLAAAFSVLLGLIAAIVLHYLLYRLGLPSQPFIYVAF